MYQEVLCPVLSLGTSVNTGVKSDPASACVMQCFQYIACSNFVVSLFCLNFTIIFILVNMVIPLSIPHLTVHHIFIFFRNACVTAAPIQIQKSQNNILNKKLSGRICPSGPTVGPTGPEGPLSPKGPGCPGIPWKPCKKQTDTFYIFCTNSTFHDFQAMYTEQVH